VVHDGPQRLRAYPSQVDEEDGRPRPALTLAGRLHINSDERARSKSKRSKRFLRGVRA
jgi:hypothetical protein